MPRCNCYKSLQQTNVQCPYNAKPGSMYCGVHRLCNVNLIRWVGDGPEQPVPIPVPRALHAPAPAPRVFHAPAPAPRVFHAPAPAPRVFHAPAPAPQRALHAPAPAPQRALHAPAPAPAPKKGVLRFKQRAIAPCKNPKSTTGHVFETMNESSIIRDKFGYCYQADEIFDLLMNNKENLCPHNGQPLWDVKNLKEFKQFIGQPAFTPVQRRILTGTFTCKNPSSLIAEEFAELDESEYVRDKHGYCYIPDEIVGFFDSKKTNKNPYTGQEIWDMTDRDEFQRFIEQPAFTDDQRRELTLIFYPPSFGQDFLDFIIRNLDTFNLIGMIGCALKADYSPDFKNSVEMLGYLNKKLLELPAIDERRFRSIQTVNRQSTLGELIGKSNVSCIHGVGAEMINLYLNIWFHLNPQPPLIGALTQLDIKSVIIFAYIHEDVYAFYLYKHNDEPAAIIAANFVHQTIQQLTHLVGARIAFRKDNGYDLVERKIEPDTLNFIMDNMFQKLDEILSNYEFMEAYVLSLEQSGGFSHRKRNKKSKKIDN
jgi:hypothetical protein